MKRLLSCLLSLILVCSLSTVSAHKLKRYPTYHVHMVVGENMLAAGKQYVKKMHFTNTNPRIISIDRGMFYAVHPGKAVITARDHTHLFTWKINVSKIIACKSITFKKKYHTIKVGQTKYLPVTFHPGNTTYQALTYKASNKHIQILSHGSIKAISPGITFITAYSTNHKKAVCQITIKK
ncbi:MAG TPA: hypothetical protein DCQ45_02890 [Erysipelotrichaceae bacterium]|nr:hypothetical protein [Erysipelotrichaceae bacterium]